MDFLYFNENAGSDDDAEYWYEALASHGIEPAKPPLSTEEEIRALSGSDRLLVAGGDGTLNYVADAVADVACAIGVLPGGTANDFARGLGIGVDVSDACKVIAEGCPGSIDLASVNGQTFLNVAHVGLGAGISEDIDASKKTIFGRFSYLVKVLEIIRSRRGFQAEISAGDRCENGRWLEIAVANGNSFGGGHPVLGADPTDGLLDVVALRPRSVISLCYEWVRVHIFNQTPNPDTVVRLRHESVRITTRLAHRVSADGEAAGETPADFSLRHHALRVLVPQSQEEPDRPSLM